MENKMRRGEQDPSPFDRTINLFNGAEFFRDHKGALQRMKETSPTEYVNMKHFLKDVAPDLFDPD